MSTQYIGQTTVGVQINDDGSISFTVYLSEMEDVLDNVGNLAPLADRLAIEEAITFERPFTVVADIETANG
jgi:hypothetical protein